MRTALLIARGVAAALLATILVVFVALSVVTQVAHRTGYPLYVIDGSSMTPSIARGGLAFEQPVVPGSIQVGDVVTVQDGDRAAYTHRVVDVVDSPDGLAIRTKGDANATADPALVPATAVVGRVLFWVPLAGYLLALLSVPMGMTSIVMMICSLAFEVWVLGDVIDDWTEESPQPAPNPGVPGPFPAGPASPFQAAAPGLTRMPRRTPQSNRHLGHARRPVRRSVAIRRRHGIGSAG
jgi:signal peptidase